MCAYMCTKKNFVNKYDPDFFIVSTNCIDARRIVEKLKKLFYKGPLTMYGDNVVPYFRSLRPDKILMEL